MTALQNIILFCSKKWWAFVLTTIIFAASLFLLMQLGETFASVTNGQQPFDTQNSLTVRDITQQLANYTPASYTTYWKFTVNDFIFPLAGGLFTAAILTFCLRHTFFGAYQWLTTRRLLPLFLLPTLFDWLENISIIMVLMGQVSAAPAVVFFKALKLSTLTLSQTLMVLGLAGVCFQWAIQHFRKPS